MATARDCDGRAPPRRPRRLPTRPPPRFDRGDKDADALICAENAEFPGIAQTRLGAVVYGCRGASCMLPPSPTAASRHNGRGSQNHSVGIRDSGGGKLLTYNGTALVRRQAASTGFAIVARGSVQSQSIPASTSKSSTCFEYA